MEAAPAQFSWEASQLVDLNSTRLRKATGNYPAIWPLGFTNPAFRRDLFRCHTIRRSRKPLGDFDWTLPEIPWLWNAQAVQHGFKRGLYPPPLMASMNRLCCALEPSGKALCVYVPCWVHRGWSR